MITPELSPYTRLSRASRTGDTVLSLCKALGQLEHRVTIAVPRYPGFEAGGLLAARRLTPLKLPSGVSVTVLDGQLSNGATLVLFDAPGLFDRQDPYGESGRGVDEVQGFGVLCSAAYALASQQIERGQTFDVVHMHDWPAAPAAALFAADTSRPALVVTLHDAGRGGVVPAGSLAAFGLPGAAPDVCCDGDLVDLAALGVHAADAVTAVSPAGALDLRDERRHRALARTLAEADAPVTGVLSGLDYSVWNPATDSVIRSRYDAEAPANKGSSKTELVRQLGLELDLARPLLVALEDETDEAAVRVLERSVGDVLRNDVAFVLATTGAVERFESLRAGHEETFVVARLPDEAMARRLCAAADLMLLPASDERTATWARVAQRYGAVPIAHASGAHKDAVVDADSALETGTGFLFDDLTEESLLGAVSRGLSAYASPRWSSLRRRVMKLDLSWDRTARRYVQVYRTALAARNRKTAS